MFFKGNVSELSGRRSESLISRSISRRKVFLAIHPRAFKEETSPDKTQGRGWVYEAFADATCFVWKWNARSKFVPIYQNTSLFLAHPVDWCGDPPRLQWWSLKDKTRFKLARNIAFKANTAACKAFRTVDLEYLEHAGISTRCCSIRALPTSFFIPRIHVYSKQGCSAENPAGSPAAVGDTLSFHVVSLDFASLFASRRARRSWPLEEMANRSLPVNLHTETLRTNALVPDCDEYLEYF